MLYSSAFTEALLAHPERVRNSAKLQKGLVIKAYAPRINKDYCLAICGNQKGIRQLESGEGRPHE